MLEDDALDGLNDEGTDGGRHRQLYVFLDTHTPGHQQLHNNDIIASQLGWPLNRQLPTVLGANPSHR